MTDAPTMVPRAAVCMAELKPLVDDAVADDAEREAALQRLRVKLGLASAPDVPPPAREPCRYCKGEGRVSVKRHGVTRRRQCRPCDGTGLAPTGDDDEVTIPVAWYRLTTAVVDELLEGSANNEEPSR